MFNTTSAVLTVRLGGNKVSIRIFSNRAGNKVIASGRKYTDRACIGYQLSAVSNLYFFPEMFCYILKFGQQKCFNKTFVHV